MATLLRLIEKSSFAAGGAFHRLRRAVADAQPPAAGEPRTEGMSAEAAAIVRRIRTRCPDRRFDVGTDEELLDLFKRNKRTLERRDENVIAAMTRPRQVDSLRFVLWRHPAGLRFDDGNPQGQAQRQADPHRLLPQLGQEPAERQGRGTEHYVDFRVEHDSAGRPVACSPDAVMALLAMLDRQEKAPTP